MKAPTLFVLLPKIHNRTQKNLNLFSLFLFSMLSKKDHTMEIPRIFRSQFYIVFSHACRISYEHLLKALKKLGQLFEDRGDECFVLVKHKEEMTCCYQSESYNPKGTFVKFFYETFPSRGGGRLGIVNLSQKKYNLTRNIIHRERGLATSL